MIQKISKKDSSLSSYDIDEREFQLRPATVEDAEFLTKFHIQSSLKQNPSWQGESDRALLFEDYFPRFKFLIKDNLSLMMFKRSTNELVFFVVQVDSYYYLHDYCAQEFPQNCNIIKFQAVLDSRHEDKFITMETTKSRGNSIIQFYGSIKPDLGGAHIATLGYAMIDKFVTSLGYQHMYMRATNIVSAIKFIMYGARILDEVMQKDQEGKEIAVMWFMVRNFDELPDYQTLYQMQKEFFNGYQVKYGESLLKTQHIFFPQL